MIALRRRDVTELNTLAHALMDSHGRLGRKRLTIAGAEFAAGDRIVCLRNDSLLGVKNGTRATVEAVDRKHRTLTVVTDRGDRIELGGRYLEGGHVRHAYALTGHAAQGVTVERAFVLGVGGQRLQEWGYVALSRARQETRLYVTGDAARAREPLPRPRRPRPRHPPRTGTRGVGDRTARSRPAPAPVRPAP